MERVKLGTIIIVYHSVTGSTKKLAEVIRGGGESIPGIEVRMIEVSLATPQDVINADGIRLGSPARVGGVACEMQRFVEAWSEAGIFDRRQLDMKIGASFATGGAMSSGRESVILALTRAMLHHGMIIVGVHEKDAVFGGSCYGASFVTGVGGRNDLSQEDGHVAYLLGRRVAELVRRLV